MKKPVCCINACYDNIYRTIEAVANCVNKSAGKEQAKKFKEKAVNCTSYEQVLSVAKNYVDIEVST